MSASTTASWAAGTEDARIRNVDASGTRVRMTTVDQLVKEYGIHQIDLLSIDTEGNDPAVILGANASLAARRVRVVEFEYHGIGRWRRRSIHDVIGVLEAMQYTCFWQSNSGKLSPFIAGCRYDFKSWSNIVCSSDRDVLRVLRLLVPMELRTTK